MRDLARDDHARNDKLAIIDKQMKKLKQKALHPEKFKKPAEMEEPKEVFIRRKKRRLEEEKKPGEVQVGGSSAKQRRVMDALMAPVRPRTR